MKDTLLLHRMQMLATARGRGLTVRLVLAAVVAIISFVLTDSLLVIGWIIGVFASQFADHRVYRRFRNPQDTRPVGKRETRAAAVSAFICAVIYMTLPSVVYFAPATEAQIFAILLICGAMLGVITQQSVVRPVFLAGIVPMAGALLLLPVRALMESGNQFLDAAVLLMAISFVIHMALGFRVFYGVTNELVTAHDDAVERGRAAEAANKAKSRFLALMSHELRTPMNGVLGAGMLLRQTKLTARQSELVDALESTGEVLMVILNDILDLAKLDAARMTLDLAPADIRELTGSIRTLWRPRAEEKGVSLILDCEIGDGAECAMLDAVRVRQVVGNLLSNAIKFTDDGEVTLAVRAERQGERVHIRFSVRDTGDGIAPETVATLFQPFSQGDDSTTRRHGGTGLGLMICRRFAELMGGSVTLDSTPGEGSCFYFSFDAEAAAMSAVETDDEAMEASQATPLSILIAEDNAINRMVVGGLLEPGGHEISFAEDGEQAVEAAAARYFDLVLMDLHMPYLDGLDAMDRIREAGGPNADAFICGLSADAGQDSIRAAMDRGMDAYVTKPIAPAELDRVVAGARAHAAGRQARDTADIRTAAAQ